MPKKRVFSPELVLAIEFWKTLSHVKLAQACQALFGLCTGDDSTEALRFAANRLKDSFMPKLTSTITVGESELYSSLTGTDDIGGPSDDAIPTTRKGRHRD